MGGKAPDFVVLGPEGRPTVTWRKVKESLGEGQKALLEPRASEIPFCWRRAGNTVLQKDCLRHTGQDLAARRWETVSLSPTIKAQWHRTYLRLRLDQDNSEPPKPCLHVKNHLCLPCKSVERDALWGTNRDGWSIEWEQKNLQQTIVLCAVWKINCRGAENPGRSGKEAL